MKELYVAGNYCVVIGNYLFAMDTFETKRILRADKLTMEVKKSVLRSDWATPWYQRDGTRLILEAQEPDSPYRQVFYVLDTDMKELSSFVADCTDISYTQSTPCFQSNPFYHAIAGDKIYCYLGRRWSSSPVGYYDTFRVYSLDGSHVDYLGAVKNGPDPLPPAINAVAGGSADVAAVCYWAAKNACLGFKGTDCFKDETNWNSDTVGISAVDLATVTIPSHDYFNILRTLGGVEYGGVYYVFKPDPTGKPFAFDGAEWVGEKPTTPAIFKYNATTLELLSWVASDSTAILQMSNAGCIVTDGTYAWGVDGSVPYRMTLATGKTKTLWKAAASNSIWFQEG